MKDKENWCLYCSNVILFSVFEPESIRGQMILKRWIMLKMFLAAVASGKILYIGQDYKTEEDTV